MKNACFLSFCPEHIPVDVQLIRLVSVVVDNMAGLNLGQEVIADVLADYLASTYGGTSECYQKKIDHLRFDWNTFDPQRCEVIYHYQKEQYW